MIKNILTKIRPLSSHNFYFLSEVKKSEDVIKINHQNSINPKREDGFAYGHYFPVNWTEQFIKKTLDPQNQNIDVVQSVRNKVGEATGKILFKFKNQKIMDNYVKKYNQDYILTENQTQKIVILPFSLKTQMKKVEQKEGKNYKNGVKLSNLDFDITQEQLKKLANDYGKISHIELSKRQSGINKGFATIYFQVRRQAYQFVSFINQFTYKERKIKAQVIVKKPQSVNDQKKYLQVPIVTLKANMELLKRMTQKEQSSKIKVKSLDQPK